MLNAYIPIFLFLLVAIGFACFTLIMSQLVQSKKYNKVKLEPYECGIEPTSDAPGEPLKAEVSRTDSPSAGVSAAPAPAAPAAPKPAAPAAPKPALGAEAAKPVAPAAKAAAPAAHDMKPAAPTGPTDPPP